MTLEANGVTVKIRHKALVDKVSLTAEVGKVLAIIGPNGAGKSTLLRALTGDARLSEGSITMGGRSLSEWQRSEQAKIRAVFSQQTALNFAFRVSEVVMMGRWPHIRGRETRHDYDIVAAAMDATDITSLADRLYATLSGGEQQRVHLARVLAQIWEPIDNQPRYLLMDEPTNNLDLKHQHTALKLARQFAQDHTAVVVILHELNLASQYADHILVMNDAGVHQIGTPKDVLCLETISQVFELDVTISTHPTGNFPIVLPR